MKSILKYTLICIIAMVVDSVILTIQMDYKLKEYRAATATDFQTQWVMYHKAQINKDSHLQCND